MGVEHFAQFLRATGHRVLRTESAYWYDASRFFLLSLPGHHTIAPEPEEIRALLWGGRTCGVRFPAPLDGPGKPSYQIVCDDRDYRLERLSANVRSKVRRGLRRCDVAAVPFSELAAHGLAADRDTLARQGRRVRLQGHRWRQYWDAAASTRGMEGWGAFVSGELVAFLVTVEFGDCVEFLLARSRSDHLDAYPNNALIFRVTEEMLMRRGMREITFGLESLEPVGPLDAFKFGMGFRQRPLRQRVIFHPLVRALLPPRTLCTGLLHWAEQRGSDGAFWKKAVGLLRFAEEGGIESR